MNIVGHPACRTGCYYQLRRDRHLRGYSNRQDLGSPASWIDLLKSQAEIAYSRRKTHRDCPNQSNGRLNVNV